MDGIRVAAMSSNAAPVSDFSPPAKNDGIGIAPENVRHIFDLFTRERSDDVEAVSGLGVGLAVVRRLASLHKGSVEARSPGKGKGSVFTLQLPLKQ